jgi:hypothetical protein
MHEYLKASKHHANMSKFFTKLAEPATTTEKNTIENIAKFYLKSLRKLNACISTN